MNTLPLYHKHRQKLMQKITDGLILINAAKEVLRNGDVHYPFRQDSNFLYLTGIDKPHHILLLDPKANKSYLFIPDINEFHRIWIGHQLTTAEAKKVYNTHYVYYHSEFEKTFQKLAKKYNKIYLYPTAKQTIKNFPKKKRIDQKTLKLALAQLRLFKSAEEIKLLKKANQISHHGHISAMKTAKPGLFEHQVQAQLESEFLKAGAFHHAYQSIVASGYNAAILHYSENNTKCKKDDLLLIDAGCEWIGYASDVTRTFPVSGKFTKKQKQIYQIVLETQKSCIKKVKPGISMLDIHEYACKKIIDGLINIGIFKVKNIEKIYQKQLHRIFFPHGIGHLLGLDVHDVGANTNKKRSAKTKNLRTSMELKNNMVITIEPGIYFIDAHFDSQKKRKETKQYINWKKADSYRSVGGIRIEDDILVTKTGYRNLTTVPKEIREIEKIMR